jgi:fluoroacetyl-CoA thioesterase
MKIPHMEMASGEAWEGDGKIGDGTHRRSLVNVPESKNRFGVRQSTVSPD